ERAGAGALVDPADGGDRDLLERLLAALAVGLLLALQGDLLVALAEVAVGAVARGGRRGLLAPAAQRAGEQLHVVGLDGERYCQSPSRGFDGSRTLKLGGGEPSG